MKIINQSFLTFDDLVFFSDGTRGVNRVAKIKLNSIYFLCLEKDDILGGEKIYGYVYKTKFNTHYSFDPLKLRHNINDFNCFTKEEITEEMIKLQKLK